MKNDKYEPETKRPEMEKPETVSRPVNTFCHHGYSQITLVVFAGANNTNTNTNNFKKIVQIYTKYKFCGRKNLQKPN